MAALLRRRQERVARGPPRSNYPTYLHLHEPNCKLNAQDRESMSAKHNMKISLWRSNVHWGYRTLFNWISSTEDPRYIGETPADNMSVKEAEGSGRGSL